MHILFAIFNPHFQSMEVSGTQTPPRLHHSILSQNPAEIRKEVKEQHRCSICLIKFKTKGFRKWVGNQQRRFMKLNSVIGLHSAARALSRDSFPYHEQVQERPTRILYRETAVSNRFDSLNEFALCKNCYRDCVRRFSDHATFNHENSTKFLYLQRHVVQAGPEIQSGRNQSNAVRARIQSEDRRNQDMNNIMNDLIEPGPSARPAFQIDPASLIIPPYRPPAPSLSPSASSQPTPQLSQQSTLPTQPSSPSTQHQSSSPSNRQHSSSPQQSSPSRRPQQQEEQASTRQTRAAGLPTAQEGSHGNDTDESDEEDYFIPIGQGDPDYDDSETDSDNSDSDDSENQDDLFSSFQSSEFQTCTAYWVPPNGYKGQVMQLLISTSMSMDRCVICAREKIEPSRLMLTWTNLWDLVEFGSLNLLGTVDQRFVCNDQCIEDFKVTDFGKEKLQEKGKYFRFYSVKQESSTFYYRLRLNGIDYTV